VSSERKISDKPFFNAGENYMKKLFSKLARDESGATAIEYGLIAALVSVALITGANLLGEQIDTTFTNLSTKMATAPKGQ
jgi:pilus assembly protein Flp/PilA